jgi:tetratricopeptide (TPR) repeat protein
VKVARRRYDAVLEKDPKDDENRGRAVYRTGALLFYEGEWADATKWLDKACKLKSRRKDFRCLRMCGQAHMRRFDENGEHAHLEKAQKRLYKALKLMPVGIEAFITLPHALMELASLYERYGAFEGALDIMGRVTEFFPGYGKYEEVMHRCVVVMHHLGNLPGSMTQTLMQRSVEFLDALMEERSGGRGVHPLAQRDDVLLLYARCCELEGGRVNKQKGQACYEQLFGKRQEAGEDDAMRHPNWRVWIGDPLTLLALGREQAETGEPTMAASLFDKAVELISERMARYRKMGITDPIGFDTFLVIAKCYASFQDMETALHYAKQAYELREFDPTVRDLLSKWSDEYDVLFKTQLEAALGVQHHWRKRVWSQDYYMRHYAICVDQWERELKFDYWNLALRAKLSYFCKRKWRMVFLFEDATAARIQKWKHDVEGMRHWRAAMKEAHLKRCAALFSKWKRHQYDPAVRAECLELAQHRKTPPTHKLCELKTLFDEQEEAVVRLQGQYQRLLAYRRVLLLKEAHKVELKLKRAAGAITIQCGLRCHWARVEVAARRVRLEHGRNLAVILQRTFRHRRGIWAQMKKMADEARAIRIAEERRVAAVELQRVWRGFLDRRTVLHVWPFMALRIQRLWRGFTVRRDIWLYKVAMATRLQHMWREKVERERWESLLRRLLEAKNAPPAPLSQALTRRLRENRSGAGDDPSAPAADPFAIDAAFPQLMSWQKKRRRRRKRSRGELPGGYTGQQDSDAPAPAAPLPPVSPTGSEAGANSSSSSSGGGGGGSSSNQPPLSPEEGEEETEWVLPSYCSIGLPGTPAWNVAVQTIELTYVAKEYQAPLMVGYGERKAKDSVAEEGDGAAGGSSEEAAAAASAGAGNPTENPQDGEGGGEEAAAAAAAAAVAGDVEEKSGEAGGEEEGGEASTEGGMSEAEKARIEQERRDKVDWRASMASRGGVDPSEAHRAKMLSGDAYFGAADGAMVAGLLRHQNCRLEKLVLLGADLHDHDAGVQVAAALSTNRTLRTLVLGGCKLHPDSVSALATALKSHNFSLRELYLDANPLGEALGEGGVGQLMEGVVADYFASQFGALHTLSLAKMGLDDSDAIALGRGLGGCVEGHLHRLNLGDNFISDDGALELLRGLRNANKVMAGRQQDTQASTVEKNKTLSPAKRSHESLRVRLGSGRRGLQELDLSNNRITDIAAVPWIEHVRDDLRVGTVGGAVLVDFTRRGPSVGLSPPELGAVSEEGGEEERGGAVAAAAAAAAGGSVRDESADDRQLTGRSDRSNRSRASNASSSKASSKNHHWGDAHPNRRVLPDQWPAWMDEGSAGSGGSLLRVALAGNLIKDSVVALWSEAAASNPACEIELQGNMFREEQDAHYLALAARQEEARRRARRTREAQRQREETEALAKATGGTHPQLLRGKDAARDAAAAAGPLLPPSSPPDGVGTAPDGASPASDGERSSSGGTPDAAKARRRRGWKRMGVAAGSKTRQQRRAEERQVMRRKQKDVILGRGAAGGGGGGGGGGMGDLGVGDALARMADWSDSEEEEDEEEDEGGSGVRLPRLSPEKQGSGKRKQQQQQQQKKKPASIGMLIASSGGGGGGASSSSSSSSKWEHPDEARARELAKPRLMQGFEPHRDFGDDVKPPPERWEDVMGPVLVDRSPDKAHREGFAPDDSDGEEDIDETDPEAVARLAHRRAIRASGTPSTAGTTIIGSPAATRADLYGGIGESGRFGGSGLTTGGLGGGEQHHVRSPAKSPMHGPSLLPTATKFTAERMAIVSNRIMRTQHLEKLSATAARRGKVDGATSLLHSRYVLPDDPRWRAGSDGSMSGSPSKLGGNGGNSRSPAVRGSQHEKVLRHYEFNTPLPSGVISPVGKGMALSARLSAGEKAPRSKPMKQHPSVAFETSLLHDQQQGAGGGAGSALDFGGFIHEEEHNANGGTFHALPSPTKGYPKKTPPGPVPVRTGSL